MNRFQIDDFGKTSVLQKPKANENDDLFLLDIKFFTLADLWTLLLGTIAVLPGETKGLSAFKCFSAFKKSFRWPIAFGQLIQIFVSFLARQVLGLPSTELVLVVPSVLTYHIVHFLIHYNKKLNRRMLEI
jgi:hypothetical protein